MYIVARNNFKSISGGKYPELTRIDIALYAIYHVNINGESLAQLRRVSLSLSRRTIITVESCKIVYNFAKLLREKEAYFKSSPLGLFTNLIVSFVPSRDEFTLRDRDRSRRSIAMDAGRGREFSRRVIISRCTYGTA